MTRCRFSLGLIGPPYFPQQQADLDIQYKGEKYYKLNSDYLGNRSLKENELIGIQLEIHFLLCLVVVNEVGVLSCCHVLVPDQSGLDLYNKKCKTCTWINRPAQSPSYRSKNERDEK